MQVIIDKGFILHCMRKRIDFLSLLESKGFKIRIPREVYQELKDVKLDNRESREDKSMVKDFIDLIMDRKSIKKMSMGSIQIKDFLIMRGNEGYYIASTDSQVLRKVPRKVIINESSGSITLQED